MAPRRLKPRTQPSSNSSPSIDVSSVVKGVIDTIRAEGDKAVRAYSEKFDKWSPPSFKLSKSDIEKAISSVDPQIIKDIKEAQANVRTFAEAQKRSLNDFEIEIQPGVHLGQKNNPISSVGTYVESPTLSSA